MQQEFSGRVAFININVNNPGEQALCIQYQIQYIPATYLLNAKGEATFHYIGAISQGQMRSKLDVLAGGR